MSATSLGYLSSTAKNFNNPDALEAVVPASAARTSARMPFTARCAARKYYSTMSHSSFASILSYGSALSFLSAMSLVCGASLLAVTSLASVLSANSILSVLSVNSVLSIGCVNEHMKICIG